MTGDDASVTGSHKPLLPLVVTEDNRLGNCRRLIFHPKGRPLVQIPDQILKCVAFISCKKHDGVYERGTVFFVSQLIPDTERYVSYAVTAKHVVKGIERDSVDGNTHLRVNSSVRGAVYIELPISAWRFHPNRVDVDVAVAPIDLDDDQLRLDILTIPRDMFVNEKVSSSEAIGCGDDLFFPGMFKHHKGIRTNIPIVRCGSIAAMPKELIETRNSGLVRAYLAEARSIGGLSGSPVFVHLGLGRHGALIPRLNPFYLLGLVHGHFNQFGEMDSAIDDIDLSKFKTPEREPLNTGIAIVVPSEDIEEVLDGHDLVSEREATRAAILEEAKQSLPVED